MRRFIKLKRARVFQLNSRRKRTRRRLLTFPVGGNKVRDQSASSLLVLNQHRLQKKLKEKDEKHAFTFSCDLETFPHLSTSRAVNACHMDLSSSSRRAMVGEFKLDFFLFFSPSVLAPRLFLSLLCARCLNGPSSAHSEGKVT